MKHDFRACIGDICLEPMTLELSQQYRVIRNEDENRKWFITTDIVTWDMQNAWFDKYMKNEADYMFAIKYKDIFSGGLAIYNVDKEKQKAEFGRLLIKQGNLRRNGIATAAIKMACNIAKEKMELKCLYLFVKDDNLVALKCYESTDFRKVGIVNGMIHMDRVL
ncbi:MAG: GNAT family N-acetyltransferase [Synergistaceae bacterium]|nr:GNAT family N-acetyltransferase [Synergistaceae bacterium]